MENRQEVHVARQPIFDRKQNVVAYELLFRGKNSTNLYDGTDGDLATQEVIAMLEVIKHAQMNKIKSTMY